MYLYCTYSEVIEYSTVLYIQLRVHRMGRITKAKARIGASDATSSVAVKPPTMKFAQAAKMADKNARTMMKISQLMVRLKSL